MKKHVVGVRRLERAHLDRLGEAFHVDYFDSIDDANRTQFLQALARAHGLIGAKLELTAAMIETASRLEVISTISAGYDNLPLAAIHARDIALCNTPDALTETTADLGFALILACARRVVELHDVVHRGAWRDHIAEDLLGSNVHGKTLGVIGLGRIGAAVARRGALGFGMNVNYALSSPKPRLEAELGARRCDLPTLLNTSDFVCVTLPFTKATASVIGTNEFQQMKPSAIFVNIARGGVVDQAALIDALDTGTILAAGLDVYAEEPLPLDSPLCHMANVTTLPHVGSATTETRSAMADRAVDNLVRVLDGQIPFDRVAPPDS